MVQHNAVRACATDEGDCVTVLPVIALEHEVLCSRNARSRGTREKQQDRSNVDLQSLRTVTAMSAAHSYVSRYTYREDCNKRVYDRTERRREVLTTVTVTVALVSSPHAFLASTQ